MSVQPNPRDVVLRFSGGTVAHVPVQRFVAENNPFCSYGVTLLAVPMHAIASRTQCTDYRRASHQTANVIVKDVAERAGTLFVVESLRANGLSITHVLRPDLNLRRECFPYGREYDAAAPGMRTGHPVTVVPVVLLPLVLVRMPKWLLSVTSEHAFLALIDNVCAAACAIAATDAERMYINAMLAIVRSTPWHWGPLAPDCAQHDDEDDNDPAHADAEPRHCLFSKVDVLDNAGMLHLIGEMLDRRCGDADVFCARVEKSTLARIDALHAMSNDSLHFRVLISSHEAPDLWSPDAKRTNRGPTPPLDAEDDISDERLLV